MNTLTLVTTPGVQPTLPLQPVRVMGIDLGTTNSTIARNPLDAKKGRPDKRSASGFV